MKFRHLLFPVCLAALAALSGCNSFESRAKERSSTYNSLHPSDQQRLERGVIKVGDTEDMVYIALGNPDQRRRRTTEKGDELTWTYNTYWQQYEGTAWAGWRRVIVPTKNGYVVYHEPVTTDVYRERVEEMIRVEFKSGHVVSIEQNK